MLGDSLRRRRKAGVRAPKQTDPKPDRPPRPASRRSRFTWWHWSLAALVVLVGSFGVGYLLSTQVLFPRPETAGQGVIVPALYGETRGAAESTIREAGLEVGPVTELASMQTERGRVLAQDPLPGQQLRAGATISLGVSGGPPELRVPPLRGMGLSSSRELLESAGFQVEVRQVPSEDIPDGMVVRTEPAAGEATRLPAMVTVFTASPPAQDSLMLEGAPIPPPESPAGQGA